MTNETKHAPGPLKVVADIDPSTPWEVQTADGLRWTARCARRSDADLYAAAPELLEALRAWERWYSEDSTEFNRDMARDSGLKAIAKATGGQP